MKWNGIENEMERKFWFGIKKTPEWNGTNRSTLVVFIAQTVYALHHSKYIAICSIDLMVDEFDRFDLFFLVQD